MNFLRRVIKLIYLNRCPCCGDVILQEKALCDECRDQLKHILTPCCKQCGENVKRCSCKRVAYVWQGFCAPFSNEGPAQQGVYGIKLQGCKTAVWFFAVKIANEVINQFPDIKFDFVCSVPMSKAERKRSEYDHARLMAVEVARKLKIKYNGKFLKKIKEITPQHKLCFEERRINVVGAFISDKLPKGCSVLLIDDIKTTGFTLNQCAKQLLLAGATNVYCASAVATENLS